MLCAAVLVVLFFLCVKTPLVNLFFESDVVLEDLNQFAKYVTTHLATYQILFHIEDAIRYAAENRVRYAEAVYKEKLNAIRSESTYKDLDSQCKSELDRLTRKREAQLAELDRRSKERATQLKEQKDKISTLQTDYSKTKTRLDLLSQTISKCKSKLRTEEEEKNKLLKDLDELGDNLKAMTVILSTLASESDSDFNKHCDSTRTSVEALFACNGTLSKQLYFIRTMHDEFNLAVVRKVEIKGGPIIFLYDKSDLSGSNLSEELQYFIRWFARSIRSVNPASLFNNRFFVVDMVSGNGVLAMDPYKTYLTVIADEKRKNELADFLNGKIREIVSGISRTEIQKASGSTRKVENLDDLNRCKMQINRENMTLYPDLFPDEEHAKLSDLTERPIEYSVAFFIVPNSISGSMRPSVLSEDLKRILMNAARYGIIPVFLVDFDTWNDSQSSEDVTYLHAIREKSLWHIRSAGSKKEKLLDIESTK